MSAASHAKNDVGLREDSKVATYVFLLGRPGSGKSTFVRMLLLAAQTHALHTVRLKDYEILYEMFLNDTQQQRFRRAAYGAFDVLDFTVLDEVLLQLREQALAHLASPREQLVIIEFARDNYETALSLFHPRILQQAHIIFVEANVETCIRRIHQRIENPVREDNHYVSDEIVREYYAYEETYDVIRAKMQEYHVALERISIIDNNGSLASFVDAVNRCIHDILCGVAI